jgi:hypothetical protein
MPEPAMLKELEAKKAPKKKWTEEAVSQLPEVIGSETSQKIFKRNSWVF